MAEQQHTPNNTPQNKQEKSSFRTLLNYIWKWLRQNFWLVMAVLVLVVVLSAQQEMLTALAKRTFVGLCHSSLGLWGLWAAMGAVALGVGVKICERFRHHSTADPRSVFLSFILLGLGLYLAFAFPFWQMHRWQTVATVAGFCLLVLGTTALWLGLPLIFFFLNHSEYRRLEAEKKAAYEDSFLVLDTPIGKDNEDLAIEIAYIKQLQKLIDSFPLDHTGTIAVTGAWGSGKTSHINVLESMLDENQYLFVRFEPMKCERPELIQSAFFDQLEDQLSDYRSGFPRYFRHYKELLGVVDSKYSKFVTTLFSISQEEARDRINHAIQNLHRRIVVFIDDVDRLDRQELEQIFRLVGFNAKFNSLVFLLAMDKTKVEATMGATDNFSDKFAEVEFYLPRQRPNAIWEFVCENVFSRLKQPESDRCRSDKGMEAYTKHCLPTMRDAKRFVNGFNFRFILMNLSDKYSFRDYFLLSLLHYADPNAFDIIAQEESFDKHQGQLVLTVKQDEFYGTRVKADNILWNLVQTLFPPKVVEQTDESWYGINNSLYFFQYFNEVSAENTTVVDKAWSLLTGNLNYNEIRAKISEWEEEPNFIKKLFRYFKYFPIDNLSDDDPRVGKYFIVCDILEIEELDFSEGLALVKKGGKYGYVDKAGVVKVPCEYDDIGSFSEGLARVKKGGKWGFVDKVGTVKVPIEYDDAGKFSEGLAKVNKGEKYGFVDKNGEVQIPIEYDFAGVFSEGLAAVKKGGKWGYVDENGTEEIPFEYDYAWSFSNGRAWIEKDGKQFRVDKEGKRV